MNLSLIILFADIFIVLGSLFSIVYLFGVVWRVEKKLDVSYKLILGSMISFTVSEILSIIDLGDLSLMKLLSLVFRAVFIVLFLLGILEARKMLRQMDKEIPDHDGDSAE